VTRGPSGPLSSLLRVLPDYAGVLLSRVQRHGDPAPVIVQAVVREGDRILLAIRGDLRGWELPGGHLEPGESEAMALAREVLEETGLEIEVGPLVGRYRRTGFHPHEARIYACTPSGGAIGPSDETRGAAYFDPQALPATVLPWCRAPIEDAIAGAPAPASREEHQGVGRILRTIAIDLRMRWTGDRVE